MAIQRLKTFQEIASRVLAEKSYRSVKEVERDLDKISELVQDSVSLLTQYRKSMVKAGTNRFVIDVDGPQENSPTPTKDRKVRHLKELDRNFAVIQTLYEAKTSLEALEAKLRTASKDMGSDVSKALIGVSAIRKQVFKGLDDAFAFLNKQASETVPNFFAEFMDKLSTLVSRSIAYEDSTMYTYMFVHEGSVCYCSYIQLKNVIDDVGAKLPELFVIASVLVDDRASEYYMDVLHEFEPPSSKLLTTKIDPGKMGSVAMDLADLLTVSHFANSIKRVPIKLLLAPGQIKRDLFNYSDKIMLVETDDESNQINFWLKPTVIDRKLADDIVKELYLDVKGLLIATRASLRVAVTNKKNKQGNDCQVISFFLVKKSDGPAANIDDIEFLKERFSLKDDAMQAILRTINKG